VFERDYAVLIRLKVPANARGIFPVRAAANWLACTDKICVPEHGELSLDVPVGQGTPNRAQFDAWRQALPRPLATPAHFAIAGQRLRVAVPLPGSVAVAEPYLFPVTDGVVDYEAPQQFRRSGDWVVAELSMKKAPQQFEGVLALADGRGLEFRAVPGSVPTGGRLIGAGGWSTQAILWAILGALAGVREDRVGLVDGLEPRLGAFVAGVLVRMGIAGKLAEGLLDLGLGRGPRHAEGLVVVLELRLLRHGASLTP